MEAEARIKQLSAQKEQAIGEQNFERAAQLRDEEQALKKEYEEKEKSMREQVSEIERKHKKFLEDYQKSNEKLLNMVESFIKAYGGKGI